MGEAQTFYLSAYGQHHFIRNTVFDRNYFYEMMREAGATGPAPSDRACEELVRILRRRGVRYILVNFLAIERFRRTYAFRFQGRQVPGYPAEINEGFFNRLVATGLMKLWHTYTADGKVDYSLGPAASALYEVPEEPRFPPP